MRKNITITHFVRTAAAALFVAAIGATTSSCTKTETPESEYVTIGGVKWATKNLGATTVAGSYATCSGDYYAWGEKYPYYSAISRTSASAASFTWSQETTIWGGSTSAKSGYDWLNYKTNGTSSDYEWSPTPYNSSTKILTSGYDAVTAALGGSWRMPTKADFDALYVACGGTSGSKGWIGSPISSAINYSSIQSKGVYWCTNLDGVAGALFSDGTKQVFFPAAGRVKGTGLEYGAARGYYWSSSLDTTLETAAINLYFTSLDPFYVNPANNDYRYFGFSVRPVAD